ncbi:MAG: PEP-CTERM sorting domain-containing protein [Planctomycetota bacterium]
MRTKSILLVAIAVVVIFCCESKAVIFNDGGEHSINYYLNEFAYAYNTTTLNIVDGAEIMKSVYGHESSTINMTGGVIRTNLYSYWLANIIVSGGTIDGYVSLHDSSTAHIYGGVNFDWHNHGTIEALDSSVVSIYGSNFSVDGQAIINGRFTHTGTGELTRYAVEGILASGEIIDTEVHLRGGATMILTPEPATPLLLGIGGVMVRRKRLKK